MENVDYLSVLIQWLFLFGLLSLLIVPAFLFKNLAKKNNRKGWLYFIIGLAIGLVGLNVGRFTTLAVVPFVQSRELALYSILIIFIVGYSFIFLAFQILKSRIKPKGGSNGSDGPQLYPKDEVV